MTPRFLRDLLLSPRGIAPPTAARHTLMEFLDDAGAKILSEVVHDGDPLEPARLTSVFASLGEPERRATLLFLHGKGGAGAEYRADAARAVALGYNVLVPELRGHAPSTGERVTFGLREKVDLQLLFQECESRWGIDTSLVGVDGCSMGALVALNLAAAGGEEGASGPRVRALWLQSPFGDLRAMALQYAERATSLPSWLLKLPVQMAVDEIEKSAGLSLSDLDPVRLAATVTCPAVIVHGESDTLVPPRLSPPVYDALRGPKELWLVPRCGHCHHPDEPQAIRAHEYVARWTAFFVRNLPRQAAPAKAKPARKAKPAAKPRSRKPATRAAARPSRKRVSSS